MEAIGAAGEQPEGGVGDLGTGVGQAVIKGVNDQTAVTGDGLGEGDELGDAAVAGPPDPSAQQCSTLLTRPSSPLVRLGTTAVLPRWGPVLGAAPAYRHPRPRPPPLAAPDSSRHDDLLRPGTDRQGTKVRRAGARSPPHPIRGRTQPGWWAVQARPQGGRTATVLRGARGPRAGTAWTPHRPSRDHDALR